MLSSLATACLGLQGLLLATTQTTSARPRLIVLTDIGGDPDDQQSMIRLMTYANEFEIEGLIATASGTPGELKQAITRPDLIRQIVEAYGQVQPNLRLHAEGYPSAEALLARIQSGNPHRGREHIGAGHDTDGSRWIIQAVARPDPRPVNVAIWGGQTDLAQALWQVREERGEEGYREFIRRIRVYDIGDQDGIADWMFQEFPGLFYVLPRPLEGQDRREAVYRGMYLGGDEGLTSREWIDTHVRTAHGPLGALYPTQTWTAPNPHGTLKEGDTPSWFYFLENGLQVPAQPGYGGWGGRFVQCENGVWRDAADTVGDTTHPRATVWRWRPAFQNDFQARLDWCVRPYAEANHPPVAVCNGDGSRNFRTVPTVPGSRVTPDASGSQDPDGDPRSYRWWVYREAGTYPGNVEITDADRSVAVVKVPADAGGTDFHVILEVTDDGDPPLTSYRRVIAEVR